MIRLFAIVGISALMAFGVGLLVQEALQSTVYGFIASYVTALIIAFGLIELTK